MFKKSLLALDCLLLLRSAPLNSCIVFLQRESHGCRALCCKLFGSPLQRFFSQNEGAESAWCLKSRTASPLCISLRACQSVLTLTQKGTKYRRTTEVSYSGTEGSVTVVLESSFLTVN